MSIFMETTKISPSRTVGDIQRIISMYGASAVMIEYDEKKEVSGLSFRFNSIPFRMPCRWQPLFNAIQRMRKRNALDHQQEDEEKAKRIAWRQILRWVEAQLALVDTGMVKTEEVFLPYIHVGLNETLFQRLEAKGLPKLLGDGGKS